MKKLNAEEIEVLAAFEAGMLKSVVEEKAERTRHREAAVATLAKDCEVRRNAGGSDELKQTRKYCTH